MYILQVVATSLIELYPKSCPNFIFRFTTIWQRRGSSIQLNKAFSLTSFPRYKKLPHFVKDVMISVNRDSAVFKEANIVGGILVNRNFKMKLLIVNLNELIVKIKQKLMHLQRYFLQYLRSRFQINSLLKIMFRIYAYEHNTPCMKLWKLTSNLSI